MKVGINTTIEVTEEQREQLARVLDGKGARKRRATRAEFKDFIWAEGQDWAIALADQSREDEDDEDLLGLTDEDEDLI